MEIEEDIKNNLINKDNNIMMNKMNLEIEIETETQNFKTKEIILNLLKLLEIPLQKLMIM